MVSDILCLVLGNMNYVMIKLSQTLSFVIRMV